MTIGIVGAGGVGQAIAKRLSQIGHRVYLVHRPYQTIAGDGSIGLLTDWQALPWTQVQALLLCVRDSQIAPLAEAIRQEAGNDFALGHTAGSISIEVLRGFIRRGVLYPLQTFSQGVTIPWGRFPIFCEGDKLFFDLAASLSGDTNMVYEADSEERLRLHIGAVFVANFTNAFLGIAERIIQKRWDHTIYLPLLKAVLEKLYFLSPEEAQTGPARRGDEDTIQKHLAYLARHWPELVALYEGMSRYIRSQSLQ